jgi:hypothetical protein
MAGRADESLTFYAQAAPSAERGPEEKGSDPFSTLLAVRLDM